MGNSNSCPHSLQSNQYFLLLFRNTISTPIGFFALHSDARGCPANDRGIHTPHANEPHNFLEAEEHAIFFLFPIQHSKRKHQFYCAGLGIGVKLLWFYHFLSISLSFHPLPIHHRKQLEPFLEQADITQQFPS